MPPLPDATGPTTSYSDPIYDRLESVAQRLTRRLGLVILALLVGIAVAVIIHSRMQESPEAASASAFTKAQDQVEEANRERDAEKAAKLAAALTALQGVASNEKITPFFRSRAFIELVQQDLSANHLGEGKAHAAKALELATQSQDSELRLKAELSVAAVQLQAGENAEAEKSYLQVESHAGAKSADSSIVAVLGAARAMELQGKLEEAATKLESITSRVDASAHELVQLARQQYWRLKRLQALKDAPPAAPAPGAAPTGSGAPAGAAPAPGAAPVAAPAAAPVPAAAKAPAAIAPAPAPAKRSPPRRQPRLRRCGSGSGSGPAGQRSGSIPVPPARGAGALAPARVCCCTRPASSSRDAARSWSLPVSAPGDRGVSLCARSRHLTPNPTPGAFGPSTDGVLLRPSPVPQPWST